MLFLYWVQTDSGFPQFKHLWWNSWVQSPGPGACRDVFCRPPPRRTGNHHQKMAFLWLREVLSSLEAPSQQLFPQWLRRLCALMGLSLHPSAPWGLLIPPLRGLGILFSPGDWTQADWQQSSRLSALQPVMIRTALPWTEGFPGCSEGEESAYSGGDALLSLGWEDPLEEGMATHSIILPWKIPWTEDPGWYSPRGPQKLDTTEQLSPAQPWRLVVLRPWGAAMHAPCPPPCSPATCHHPGSSLFQGTHSLFFLPTLMRLLIISVVINITLVQWNSHTRVTKRSPH